MKKNATKNPFTHLVLDAEEAQIESALEKGEYHSDSNFSETKKMLEEAALNYKELTTARPITARVNQLDLIKFKARAKAKNIPYQTLLGILIHQYVEGTEEVRL